MAQSAFSYLDSSLYTDIPNIEGSAQRNMDALQNMTQQPALEAMNPQVHPTSEGARNNVKHVTLDSASLENMLQTLYARIASAEKRTATMEERVLNAFDFLEQKKDEQRGCSWWFYFVSMLSLLFLFIVLRNRASFALPPATIPRPSQSHMPYLVSNAGGLAATVASPVTNYATVPLPAANNLPTSFIPPNF